MRLIFQLNAIAQKTDSTRSVISNSDPSASSASVSIAIRFVWTIHRLMPFSPSSSSPGARATPGICLAMASHCGLILRDHIIPPLLVRLFLIRRPFGLLLKVWAVRTNMTSLLAIITHAFVLVFLIQF